VIRPWLTIWTTAPVTAICRPVVLPDSSPAAPNAISTYPMWLTEV